MLATFGAGVLTILGVLARQSAVSTAGVFLVILFSFAMVAIWMRYYVLWFRLYLPRNKVGLPDENPETPVEDEEHLVRRYVRARCNSWRGSKRSWLWTLPWGIRVKPRGGPRVDLRWSDMTSVQLISMNMVRASDQLYVRIRTGPGLIMLLTARDFGDWRDRLLEAMHSNGVTVSADSA